MIKDTKKYKEKVKEILKQQNQLRKLKYLNSYKQKETTTTINQPIEKQTNKGYKIFDRNINLLEKAKESEIKKEKQKDILKEGRIKKTLEKEINNQQIKEINEKFAIHIL